MKKIPIYLSLVISALSFNIIGGEISVDSFKKALQRLYEDSDYVFLDKNSSEAEKDLLSRLIIKPPENEKTGLGFDFQDTLEFEQEHKDNPSSRYNKLRNNLIDFFSKTTNAETIDKNGNQILADMLLSYGENIMKAYGTNWMFLSLKAFHPDDLFRLFPRWHYDGKQSEDFVGANVNFAGVMKGEPTILTKIIGQDRNKLEKKAEQLNVKSAWEHPVSFVKLIEKLNKFKEIEENNEIKEGIQHEIERLRLWQASGVLENSDQMRKYERRFLLHKYMKKNLIFEIDTPKQSEAVLFTMTGKKPALHSEPDIAKPRLFFSIRLYDDYKKVPYSGNWAAGSFNSLPNPITY